MKQLYTKNKAVAALKKSGLLIAWVFIFVIASLHVHAQEIAGEMDVEKLTFNKSTSPASADLFTDADFKLYPNPAKEVIYIQSKVKLKEGVTFTLSDMKGTILEKRYLTDNMSSNKLSFDIGKYTEGLYIIGIRSIDGSYVTKKLMKR